MVVSSEMKSFSINVFFENWCYVPVPLITKKVPLPGKKALSGPRSLQSSPFHSPPRILSPLDLRHFPLESSYILPSCPSSPKLSRKASRRSISRRSLASSVANLTEAQQVGVIIPRSRFFSFL